MVPSAVINSIYQRIFAPRLLWHNPTSWVNYIWRKLPYFFCMTSLILIISLELGPIRLLGLIIKITFVLELGYVAKAILLSFLPIVLQALKFIVCAIQPFFKAIQTPEISIITTPNFFLLPAHGNSKLVRGPSWIFTMHFP